MDIITLAFDLVFVLVFVLLDKSSKQKFLGQGLLKKSGSNSNSGLQQS